MQETIAPVFLRFVLNRKHSATGVREGVFGAAYDLLHGHSLSIEHRNALKAHMRWFAANLKTPARFNRSRSKGWYRRETKGISWLKADAREHVARMRSLSEILEEYGFPSSVLRSTRPGYIVYEDDFQVVAEPFADTKV